MNLCEILDVELERLNKEQREKHGVKKSHYPSEMTDCMRKLWYRWNSAIESNPIEGRNLLKMAIGNVIHDFVFSLLEKKGVQIVNEIEFKFQCEGSVFPVSGRIDYLFVDGDGKLTGVEVKTTSGYGTDSIIKANFPKLEHLSQVGVYTSCTEVKRFIVLYIDQQKSWKKQFSVNNIDGKIYVEDAIYEGFNFEKVCEKIRKIENNFHTSTIPDRDFQIAIVDGIEKDKFTKDKIDYKSAWQCQYCQYHDLCWSEIIKQATVGKFYGEVKIV